MHKIMYNNKFHKFAGLLIVALLAGCATPPVQKDTKTAQHLFTSDIKTLNTPPATPAKDGNQAAADPRMVDKSAGKAEIYPGTGVFVKAPPSGGTAAKLATGDEVMLNFEGADLREVVKAIVVDFLRETYIMDTRVQGVVNLHTTNPIPRAALLPTLETLLRMNGAAIVKEEGVFKVVPAANAARGSLTPKLGSANLQSGYSVQIVPLKFLAAKEMVKILEPFVSEASAVRIDEVRNLMILAGTERELRHLQETIDMFDIDWLAGMSVGLFTLQSVDVKTAVADLDKVFGAAAQSPLSGVLRLVPIERLNAILVITPQPKYLDQAKIWIERMDRAGGSGGGTRLFVYPVQNGQAEKLATLINDVFGKSKSTKTTPAATLAPGLAPAIVNSTTAPPATPAPGQPPAATSQQQQPTSGDSISVAGDVRVIADKDNNALLILASPSDYEKIEAAIRRLDIVPRQVLVDVTVAEVSLTGDLQFGLEWYFAQSKTIDGGTVFNNGNRGTLTGFREGATSGAQYIWSNARVGALMHMLQNDSRAKVISSPHIMVTDNQTAKIQVGQQISVTTQQQSGTATVTGLVSTFQYLNTGILLSVTPHINAGGMVTMDINQEVSTVGDAPAGTNPPINRRAVQSTVVVRSGEMMMLGGLIQDQTNKSASGLPLLSQIPVIGGLFGSQGIKDIRTELVIMITPRVVSNSLQAREVTDEFRKKLGGLTDFFENNEKVNGKSKEEKQEN